MYQHITDAVISKIAAADLLEYRATKLHGTANQVQYDSAASGLLFGFTAANIDSGKVGDIATEGTCYAVASGNIAIGDEVETTGAVGLQAAIVAAATPVLHYRNGIAMSAAANGQQFLLKISPQSVQR